MPFVIAFFRCLRCGVAFTIALCSLLWCGDATVAGFQIIMSQYSEWCNDDDDGQEMVAKFNL